MNEFISVFSDSDPTNVSTSIKLLLLLTVLSLAPSILILMTSFARIVIVLVIYSNSISDKPNASEPSDYWISVIFNVFYHGTYIPRSE